VTLFSTNELAREHNTELPDQLKTPVVDYHAVEEYKQLGEGQAVPLVATMTAAKKLW